MRLLLGAAAWLGGTLLALVPAHASPCINIFHDEVDRRVTDRGPINAIMLANLLGHWPQYEIRVRPIADYTTDLLQACKATFYLGTSVDTNVPGAFLSDFFATERQVAWIGYGTERLNSRLMAQHFRHRVAGYVGLGNSTGKEPAFFQHVSYKGAVFKKSVDVSGGQPHGAFSAVRYVPVSANARDVVLAELLHNKTFAANPYFLRAGNRFLVGDIPFAYMHEGDRYFAFADLLFDILDEQPLRSSPLAFARMEDIHGHYDLTLLRAATTALAGEGVPISVAHIPYFADPLNAYGLGPIVNPQPATGAAAFTQFIDEIGQSRNNAVILHGVTHQFGDTKNPHSGTSGDDYEFWNMVANKPVQGDGVAFTLDRLAKALPIYSAYGMDIRYWVTPHYHASATNARVFAEAFPWSVGRVTYYPSSFKPAFTIPAAPPGKQRHPSLTAERIAELRAKEWPDLDARSKDGLTQMFPYEIYRDVYGQRVIPETLGYLSYATSDQTAFIRTAEDMLADAQRGLVVRDYWASFFFHPYLFAAKSDGGVGRYTGDTVELRKVLIGLKMLGYRFVGLPEFEEHFAATREPDGQRKPQEPRSDG